MRYFLLLFTISLSLLCILLSQTKRVELNSVSKSTPISSKDTLRLLFVGDLMQHQEQINAAYTTKEYDYSSYFKYVTEEIKKADFAIANLEVTFGGKPYKGYPTFSAPDEYLTAIYQAGFNVLLTANNHCLDKRRKGLERTIYLLDSMNILHAGTYKNYAEREKKYPLLLQKNNFRIAILNYTYGTNGIPVTSPNIVNYIDTAIISNDIKKCKELNSDIIIACMHWGIEYKTLPNDEQKSLAKWLLKKGVDHIIGSHPHVIQPIEIQHYNDKKHLVVYSLGNYISNMSARHTDGGLMVKMELTKDSIAHLSDYKYSLVWTARPVQSGKKNYQLYPINIQTDSLSNSLNNSLRKFANDTREFFHKLNIEDKEYFFYKKKQPYSLHN